MGIYLEAIIVDGMIFKYKHVPIKQKRGAINFCNQPDQDQCDLKPVGLSIERQL